MFCPKCGTQNPETGNFCRSCGTDLATVSDALTGKAVDKSQDFGMIQPLQPMQVWGEREKPVNWEGAIGRLFTGLAFLIVAAVLGITGIAGGKFWWFWMLIPAFGSLGSGVAQYIQLKKSEKNKFLTSAQKSNQNLASVTNAALPSSQADLSDIRQLANAGKKIEAIKIYREIFGVDLKEAKESVEKLVAEQTLGDYIQPPQKSIYDTGELVAPPSVVEGTTRHLEINNEGETMTLPKK